MTPYYQDDAVTIILLYNYRHVILIVCLQKNTNIKLARLSVERGRVNDRRQLSVKCGLSRGSSELERSALKVGITGKLFQVHCRQLMRSCRCQHIAGHSFARGGSRSLSARQDASADIRNTYRRDLRKVFQSGNICSTFMQSLENRKNALEKALFTVYGAKEFLSAIITLVRNAVYEVAMATLSILKLITKNPFQNFPPCVSRRLMELPCVENAISR